MKTSVLFFLLAVISITGCKKDSDNTITPTTSQYKGTWEISNYTTVNYIQDSIIVKLSMDGNNGALTGTGNIVYGTNKSGSTVVIVINGNITGSYTDSNLSIIVTDKTTANRFTYSGTKQASLAGQSYVGNGAIITSTDTTNLGSLTFFKGS